MKYSELYLASEHVDEPSTNLDVLIEQQGLYVESLAGLVGTHDAYQKSLVAHNLHASVTTFEEVATWCFGDTLAEDKKLDSVAEDKLQQFATLCGIVKEARLKKLGDVFSGLDITKIDNLGTLEDIEELRQLVAKGKTISDLGTIYGLGLLAEANQVRTERATVHGSDDQEVASQPDEEKALTGDVINNLYLPIRGLGGAIAAYNLVTDIRSRRR